MRDPHASPSFENPVGLPDALAQARCVLIVRRLPIFASCWLVTMLAGRRDPAGPLVRSCVTMTVVLLGLSTTILFGRIGGNGDILAFVLLTLYLSSSLFFAWGWRPAIGVWVMTVALWALAIP